MTIYDDGIQIAEECPNCNSNATNFDPTFGFWKCEDCSTVWGHSEDDPDYDEIPLSECSPEAREAIQKILKAAQRRFSA